MPDLAPMPCRAGYMEYHGLHRKRSGCAPLIRRRYCSNTSEKAF